MEPASPTHRRRLRSRIGLGGSGRPGRRRRTTDRMFGGGADVKLNHALAVRLIQADWVYYRFSGNNESHNVRVSTGIVFRF